MNKFEVSRVLGKCAAYDKRTVGDADILAWHEILEYVDYTDGLDAVTRHYRQTRDFAMPADILTHAKLAKADRQRRERQQPAARLALPPSKFTPEAERAAAPAFERTAELRTAARAKVAQAQRKFDAARKSFRSAEEALAALDDALTPQEGQP